MGIFNEIVMKKMGMEDVILIKEIDMKEEIILGDMMTGIIIEGREEIEIMIIEIEGVKIEEIDLMIDAIITEMIIIIQTEEIMIEEIDLKRIEIDIVMILKQMLIEETDTEMVVIEKDNQIKKRMTEIEILNLNQKMNIIKEKIKTEKSKQKKK